MPQGAIVADKTRTPGLLYPQASTQHFLSWPLRNLCDRIATIKCQFGYTRSDP
jgi:hypothetical protein